LNYIWNIIEIYATLVGVLSLCVLPCWCICGRFKMSPSVRLFITATFNFVLFYLLEGIAYILSLPSWFPFCVALGLTAVSVVSILSNKNSLSVTVSGLVSWLVLATWIVSFQLGVVVYGGASWFGDWIEHYERALFFLEQKPLELNGKWPLSANGSLLDTVAALLMSLFGKDFWVYQIIATVLNTFVVLPFALLIQSIVKIKQAKAHWLSLFVMALASFAFQMELYTNAKLFALAFILGAIYLYRRGIRTDRPNWSAFGMIVLSTGFLVDHQVFPFAVFFAGHFLFVTSKRNWGIKIPLYAFLSSGILISSCFLFSQVGYEDTSEKTIHSKDIILGNMLTTIIPYSFRRDWEGIAAAPVIVQKDGRYGKEFEPQASDQTFEWYCDLVNNQGSLLSNLGIAGFLGIYLSAGWIARNANILKNRAQQAKTLLGWKFWALFFGIGIPFNIALSPNLLPQGTAHLNLHIFVCLTAIWIFKYLLPLPRHIKQGLAVIFIAESLLTMWALMNLITRPVPIAMMQEEKLFITGKLGLNPVYVDNFILKLKTNVVFLSDQLGTYGLRMGILINVLLLLLTSGIFYWTSKKG
jgi:hypothetical protein